MNGKKLNPTASAYIPHKPASAQPPPSSEESKNPYTGPVPAKKEELDVFLEQYMKSADLLAGPDTKNLVFFIIW